MEDGTLRGGRLSRLTQFNQSLYPSNQKQCLYFAIVLQALDPVLAESQFITPNLQKLDYTSPKFYRASHPWSYMSMENV